MILFNLPGASSARVTCERHMVITGGHFVLFCFGVPYSYRRSSVNMDEGSKGRVSELLSEASGLLSSSSSSTASNPAVNLSRSGSAMPQATISETLRRAQGMLRESTSAGRNSQK